ncbi:MAG: HD domain-containing protein [Treponema sp.]|nr:HD domain-containing protein [Treponema sp.]
MQSSFEQTIKNFLPSDDGRLDSLLKFSALAEEMDKISRRTKLADGSRRQNDAEHSWRIALMALMFKDYFDEEVDATRAAAICVAHDLVEIYAGDTFAYDAAANVGKEEREEAAAQKLFGQLPDDIARKLRALWNEFEEFKTPESRYANCMDRLEPFLNNSLSLTGGTWAEAGATVAMVEKRIGPLKENMPRVWEWVQKNIERGKSRGFIKE